MTNPKLGDQEKIVDLTPIAIHLTKREWFAGLAMQGLLAGNSSEAEGDKLPMVAIWYADELIKQLGGKDESREDKSV
jgi:hypothetical protein